MNQPWSVIVCLMGTVLAPTVNSPLFVLAATQPLSEALLRGTLRERRPFARGRGESR
jgi:hypothetical protein